MLPDERPDESPVVTGMDGQGQAEIEGRPRGEAAPSPSGPPAPPAGPHGAPDLTEPAATPGAGTLPGAKSDGEADAATG